MKPWIRIGLFFAVWMMLFMTFVSPYIMYWIGLEDDVLFDFSAPKLIISAVCYTIGGIAVGYINRNNKKVKNQIDA